MCLTQLLNAKYSNLNKRTASCEISGNRLRKPTKWNENFRILPSISMWLKAIKCIFTPKFHAFNKKIFGHDLRVSVLSPLDQPVRGSHVQAGRGGRTSGRPPPLPERESGAKFNWKEFSLRSHFNTVKYPGLGSNGVTVTKFLQLLMILELYL